MNDVITRSSRPMRRPRTMVSHDARMMPVATRNPKGLIDNGIGGKPPITPWGTRVSSGKVMYGISGAASMPARA
jgi:hypothetical protein